MPMRSPVRLSKRDDAAVLQLGINRVRIFRIDLRAKTVAAMRYEPIAN